MSPASLTRLFPRVFLCLAVVIPILAGCDRQSGTTAQPRGTNSPASDAPAGDAPVTSGLDRSHKGEPVPDLTFQTPDGHTLHLAAKPVGADSGKPLLVNLWATWCAPCVAELPTLDRLAAGGSVRVVALSQDMGPGATIAAFLKDKGAAHLTPWLDANASASTRFGGASLPMTIYYDASGHELWRWNGGNDWSGPTAARLLAEAR